jgi:hemerythrin-like domain-containing protein
MIIDLLRQEHRNMEKLLLVLELEVSVFGRGERPDYEVIWAVIAYFQVFPDAYHHPQENAVFEKLTARDPAAAAKIGDLADIIRDFIVYERRHIAVEERDFFPVSAQS